MNRLYWRNFSRPLVIFLLVVVCLIATATPAAAESSRITIKVTNAQVRDVLTTLTGVGGTSIIFDESVTADSAKGGGRITLELTGVLVEEAIDMITKVKGLAYLRQGDIYIIGTPERINKGFEAVRIAKIKYAKAEDVKKAITLIIPEDRLKVDEANNLLIYTGSSAEATPNRTRDCGD